MLKCYYTIFAIKMFQLHFHVDYLFYTVSSQSSLKTFVLFLNKTSALSDLVHIGTEYQHLSILTCCIPGFFNDVLGVSSHEIIVPCPVLFLSVRFDILIQNKYTALTRGSTLIVWNKTFNRKKYFN